MSDLPVPSGTFAECGASFAGLTCALGDGHESDWHWDPRGVDWRENPGIPVLIG